MQLCAQLNAVKTYLNRLKITEEMIHTLAYWLEHPQHTHSGLQILISKDFLSLLRIQGTF